MAECRPKHAQSSGCNLERPDWFGHEIVITENYTGMMAMVLPTSWHRDRLDRLLRQQEKAHLSKATSNPGRKTGE